MTWDVKEDTKARFILNSFDMPYAKDPLGLTTDEFNQDASKAGSGRKYFTRKAVAQNQFGTVLEHKVDKDLELMACLHRRHAKLAIPSHNHRRKCCLRCLEQV
jgi:hypothetical protein